MLADASMTRREFVGWMLASVAAMVAGSRIWRLFRWLFEEQREQLVGVVTEVNQALKTITVSYSDQHGRHWTAAVDRGLIAPLTAGDYIVFANAT